MDKTTQTLTGPQQRLLEQIKRSSSDHGHGLFEWKIPKRARRSLAPLMRLGLIVPCEIDFVDADGQKMRLPGYIATYRYQGLAYMQGRKGF